MYNWAIAICWQANLIFPEVPSYMEYLGISLGHYDFCAWFSQTAALGCYPSQGTDGSVWYDGVLGTQRDSATEACLHPVSQLSQLSAWFGQHPRLLCLWLVPCQKVLHVLQLFLPFFPAAWCTSKGVSEACLFGSSHGVATRLSSVPSPLQHNVNSLQVHPRLEQLLLWEQGAGVKWRAEILSGSLTS